MISFAMTGFAMRRHYYSLAFTNDKGQTRSGIIAQLANAVAVPDIQNVRASLEMDENAAILSVCYLGCMTEQEYRDGVTPGTRWRTWYMTAACLLPFVILGLVVWLRG